MIFLVITFVSTQVSLGDSQRLQILTEAAKLGGILGITCSYLPADNLFGKLKCKIIFF